MGEAQAREVARSCPFVWVDAWVKDVQRDRKTPLHNPAGLIYRMYRDGVGMPARASPRPKPPDDGRRYITGEYAEYVQH